jgi:hypothetical protein
MAVIIAHPKGLTGCITRSGKRFHALAALQQDASAPPVCDDLQVDQTTPVHRASRYSDLNGIGCRCTRPACRTSAHAAYRADRTGRRGAGDLQVAVSIRGRPNTPLLDDDRAAALARRPTWLLCGFSVLDCVMSHHPRRFEVVGSHLVERTTSRIPVAGWPGPVGSG